MRRYAREFDFVKSVACIRTGSFLTKAEKGWDKKEGGFRGDQPEPEPRHTRETLGAQQRMQCAVQRGVPH